MIDANAPHSAAPKTDYTPTTDEVRMAYGDSQCVYMDDPAHAHGCPQDEEFDRWLAEYTRQQREEAWNYTRSEVRSIPSWYNPETGKGGFDLQPLGPDESSEEGAWDAVMSILDVNPYRKETP